MIMRSSEASLAAPRRIAFIAAMMLAVAAGTAVLKPAPTAVAPAPDLEALLPDTFGAWRQVPIADVVLPKEAELGPGEAVAYRAYKDGAGRVITLVAAYGPPLGDSVRLHRPESCYAAQGYRIRARRSEALDLAGVRAAIVRLETAGATHDEAVTYWLRSGPAFVTAASTTQMFILREGRRTGLDGALVRASSPGDDPTLFDLHREFLKSFAAALSPEARTILLGEGGGA